MMKGASTFHIKTKFLKKCDQNIVSYLFTSKVVLFYKVCTRWEHYKVYKSKEEKRKMGIRVCFVFFCFVFLRKKWSSELL